MPVLLLRLAGPMQSWGTQSRFTNRDTGREPAKSGVLGLLCAAMGVPRGDDETLSHLAALRMGVRVDREGRVARDYHTAGGGRLPSGRDYGVIKASGAKGDPVVSDRFYLTDAEFLVGLEGNDRDLLERCHRALRVPHWPLALGRKAFTPGLPIYLDDGLVEGDLRSALRAYHWRPRREGEVPQASLRMVVETDDTTQEVRLDQPLSFALGARRYALRYITTSLLPVEELQIGGLVPCTSLD